MLSNEEAGLPAAKNGIVGGVEILSNRVRRELERHVSPHERVLFCLSGNLAHSLIALEERLIIVKPGFHAGTTFGSLERIADLHRTGALSEPEYERLKQVLIDNAHKGAAQEP